MGVVKRACWVGVNMNIKYLRSSSYNQWTFCQQQYFINYVLGLPQKSTKKALKGTVVHKVLECLAIIKHQIDKQQNIFFDDKELGKIPDLNVEDLYKKETLTNQEIDTINTTRLNKTTYPEKCCLSYGHIRTGIKVVERLIETCYNYYKEDNWSPVDFKDCTNWVWMVLDYNNGLFDPRNRKIVAPEKKFDIEIKKDWALVNNNTFLKIKGTIDLIVEVSDGIIEIIDFKTGRRIDWSAKQDNTIKTYEKLCEDFQLMLYYYAAQKLYPNTQQILMTIFYVRDGGPFTMCFDNDTVIQTEEKIRQRLEEITNCQLPVLHDPSQKHFKCKLLCDYYKMKAPDNKTNMCLFIHQELQNKGMSQVVKSYTHKGFDIGYYEAPG
jgi:hypothetical protein